MRRRPLEADVQAAICKALDICQVRYFVTTAYRQKGSSGVDKGVPDLLIELPTTGRFLGLEVKKPGKIIYSSPEQRDAHQRGATIVVQSPLEALLAIEDALGWEPNVKPLVISRVTNFINSLHNS